MLNFLNFLLEIEETTWGDVWDLYGHIVTVLVNLRHAEELGDFLQDYTAVNRGNLCHVTNLMNL